MDSPLDQPLDKENAFLLYAVFCGDAARTAHALDVPPQIIQDLAHAEAWDAKLKPIIDLKASTRPGDVERGVNRAVNYVQGHRFRMLLQRMLKKMSGLTEEELDEYIFAAVTDKSGVTRRTLTAKGLADMASALEKCHAMTYLALNDTATDRRERDEGQDDNASAAEMHVKLAEAMQAAGGKAATVRGMVLDAQLTIAQEIAAKD